MRRTRTECIASLQQQLDRMPEKEKDRVFVSCACGQHRFTPRQLVEAVKDHNNSDGTKYYEAWATLEEQLENEVLGD